MTLVNVRAAFEKAVTDAVNGAYSNVTMVYDNVAYTIPGKTTKYITMTISFTQSTLQNQGAASDYYSGVIQCNVYVPHDAGTGLLSRLSEAVIDGLTSVNDPDYVDLQSVVPRVTDINGPNFIDRDNTSHYLAIISCQFTAVA